MLFMKGIIRENIVNQINLCTRMMASEEQIILTPFTPNSIRWSPRVPKWKLRQLYQQVSLGIYDEELINDIGMTLYERCQDILNIHRARVEKKVTCPKCWSENKIVLIDRQGPREELLQCPGCGWSMQWYLYQRSYKRRQLNPGGAVKVFSEFVNNYIMARNPQDKVLSIDRLIHEFHYSLREDPDRPTRPAGVNLISGNLEEVVAFLDELSGLDLPENLENNEKEWREKVKSTYWPQYLP